MPFRGARIAPALAAPGPATTRRRWLWLPAAALALLGCHLIRSHLLEWYLVPSRSMEPTLHGDPRTGDLVLVDKTAFWFSRPRQYDLVVLRGTADDDAAYLVKRLVATGDGPRRVVCVHDGDVWTGSTRQTLLIDTKHPVASRGLRVTRFLFPEVGEERFEQFFTAGPGVAVDRAAATVDLSPTAATPAALIAPLGEAAQQTRRRASPPQLHLPGHASTQLPVDTQFLDADGARQGVHELHRDNGIEVQVEPLPGCAAVQLVLEHDDRYLAFTYALDGAWQLTRMGTPLPAAPADPAGRAAGLAAYRGGPGPALLPGRPLRLAFGYLDGWLFAEADGELLLHEPHRLPYNHERRARFPGAGMANLLHIGAAGSGGVRLHRVRVFHDVYHQGMPGPFGEPQDHVEIAPGMMFLLGDNSRDSRDSRMGRLFPVADLVGRPLAVIGPWHRMRWLGR